MGREFTISIPARTKGPHRLNLEEKSGLIINPPLICFALGFYIAGGFFLGMAGYYAVQNLAIAPSKSG
ncbi:hypothetical protein [Intestinimonas massiliensis (ex Afouda et al. 2020)]|uniref:Uncharacterized protein n=1 Tax=Intestinimonas massiliensis (ex Afouda et al. 2020) TaxID=1673721 RepID=A0ABS9MC50_9FIRM|nr:hypothetical protein [Intestinimonas massiliensis (ex Afouda et al. 2020)]MCG4528387.1 hypothetical protein [Intestinimonas massiliensis (ex Afouda et al. 2020)]